MISTVETSPQIDVERVNAELAGASPETVIAWAAGRFGDDLLMTSSFGADSMCLIHMATQIVPDVRIVFVNTGFLFPETLTFMEEMRLRFGLNVREYHTARDPIVYLSVNGETDPRVRNNVDACCAANKNEVFDRAMRQEKPRAWLRGVRAEQSTERANMRTLQYSRRNDCWSLSPLLRFTSKDVFQYMKLHNLPHHPLWEKGYTSIGCNPATCTRPVGLDEDARDGRWSGLDKKECGIHLDIGAGI